MCTCYKMRLSTDDFQILCLKHVFKKQHIFMESHYSEKCVVGFPSFFFAHRHSPDRDDAGMYVYKSSGLVLDALLAGQSSVIQNAIYTRPYMTPPLVNLSSTGQGSNSLVHTPSRIVIWRAHTQTHVHAFTKIHTLWLDVSYSYYISFASRNHKNSLIIFTEVRLANELPLFIVLPSTLSCLHTQVPTFTRKKCFNEKNLCMRSRIFMPHSLV